MMIEHGGKKYVVHPTKGGFVFVFDRKTGKPVNVYKGVDNINFVKDIKPEWRTGRPPRSARRQAHEPVPGDRRRLQLERGQLQPEDRPAVQGRLRVVHRPRRGQKTEPITEPVVQLNIGADFTMHGPGKRQAAGHIRARDPITGKVKFEITYQRRHSARQPADHRGQRAVRAGSRRHLVAYDATNGKKLWSHNDGQGTTAASSPTWPRASSTWR